MSLVKCEQNVVLVDAIGVKGPNILCAGPCADPEGCWGQGVRILSNTGLDRLKNRKATKPAFNIGPSSALPVKRHINGVSLSG